MRKSILLAMGLILILSSCSKDYSDYRTAMKTQNPRKISKYIESTESDKYKEKAEKKLENLYYKHAKDEVSCLRYLAKYPGGKYVEETKVKLEDLSYQSAKESIFAVEDYINKYPDGKYINDKYIVEAQKTLKDLMRPLSADEIKSVLADLAATATEAVAKNEYALIETNFGTMKMKFFPDVAPGHCANFKRLANSGYYDGVKFHRVIPGFMIQGGDIKSRDGNRSTDGMGGPGYTIDAEFNDISHTTGIVSMARTPDPNSAGSQFFICDGSPSFLDGQYTVFGQIVEGMSIISKIVNVPRDKADNPLKPIYMRVRIVKG